MVNIVLQIANIFRIEKDNLFIVKFVEKNFGENRCRLDVQKANNFFVLNLIKHYGEIVYFLEKRIQIGKMVKM